MDPSLLRSLPNMSSLLGHPLLQNGARSLVKSAAQKLLDELRADVLIANPPPQVEKLMRLASIDKLVRIVYTAHTASVKE